MGASAPTRFEKMCLGSSEPSAHGKAGKPLKRSLSSSMPSKVYLKDYRVMQEAKARAQKATVEHANSASLYRHLCHMSEANALVEDLGLQTRFRPHRKEKKAGSRDIKDEVVCRIYEDGVLSTEVPMEIFERRFKSLQSRWNQLVVAKADKQQAAAVRKSQQATKQVALPSSGAASRGQEPSGSGARPATLLSQEEQDNLQRQIKRVTLETLALADRMWQQLDGLEKDPKPLNPFVIH